MCVFRSTDCVSQPLFWFEILNLACTHAHSLTKTISTKHILKWHKNKWWLLLSTREQSEWERTSSSGCNLLKVLCVKASSISHSFNYWSSFAHPHIKHNKHQLTQFMNLGWLRAAFDEIRFWIHRSNLDTSLGNSLSLCVNSFSVRHNHSFFLRSAFDELKNFWGFSFNYRELSWLKCQNAVMDSCLSKFNSIESVPWLHRICLSFSFAFNLHNLWLLVAVSCTNSIENPSQFAHTHISGSSTLVSCDDINAKNFTDEFQKVCISIAITRW